MADQRKYPLLAGVRVIDLSRLVPGPFCTMVLADLGAQVIKVAQPGEAPRPPALPTNPLDRNKRSISLDLKRDAARQVLYRLVESSDVVVEGFRPGVTARLGVDYESLSRTNPRLIYCSITGYGQTGPYKLMPGHEINYISLAGALGMIGRPGSRPTIPHNLLGDIAGGGLMGATAILAALVERSKTGKGRYLDLAITDGVMYLMAQAFARYFQTGIVPKAGETHLDGGRADNETYKTQDARYLSVSCSEPKFFRNLCQALGLDYLIPLQGNTPKVRAAFEEIFAKKTRDQWFELLKDKDVCVAKVYSLDEVEADPHVQSRDMVRQILTYDGQLTKQIAPAIKLQDIFWDITRPPPRPGQDTDEILAEIGYDPEDITSLRTKGALG